MEYKNSLKYNLPWDRSKGICKVGMLLLMLLVWLFVLEGELLLFLFKVEVFLLVGGCSLGWKIKFGGTWVDTMGTEEEDSTVSLGMTDGSEEGSCFCWTESTCGAIGNSGFSWGGSAACKEWGEAREMNTELPIQSHWYQWVKHVKLVRNFKFTCEILLLIMDVVWKQKNFTKSKSE